MPRTRATFAKRQKEQARREKQLAKAQRKLERKLGTQQGSQSEVLDHDLNEIPTGADDSLVSQMDSQ